MEMSAQNDTIRMTRREFRRLAEREADLARAEAKRAAEGRTEARQGVADNDEADEVLEMTPEQLAERLGAARARARRAERSRYRHSQWGDELPADVEAA
jgi:hypothetical protein